MEVYEVQVNEDTLGGRGGTVRVAVFRTREVAMEVAKSKGPMVAGRVVVVPVYDTIADYEAACDEAVRQRALAKLTPEERRALGLVTP